MLAITLAFVAACGSGDDAESSEVTSVDSAPATAAPPTDPPPTEAPPATESTAPPETTSTTEAPEPPPTEAPPVTEPVSATATCVEGAELVAPGVLTVATWFDYAAEQDGGGYEKAVLDAVAGQLGFDADQIVFDLRDVMLSPDQDMAAPGEKDFDLAISFISITDARRAAVDLVPYYDVDLVLVAAADSSAASATSITDLSDLTLGAFETTASVTDGAGPDYVALVVEPSGGVVVVGAPWDDPAGDRAALADGTVDAYVMDQVTADYLFDPEQDGPWATFDELSVVAVLPPVEPPFEQMGFALEMDSALTPCVDLALAALRDDGVLADLEEQWLRDDGSIPVLST